MSVGEGGGGIADHIHMLYYHSITGLLLTCIHVSFRGGVLDLYSATREGHWSFLYCFEGSLSRIRLK